MSDSNFTHQRRQLLRGRLAARPSPIRPPWAVELPAFLDKCSRCGDCIKQCETGILIKGDGGFPEVDFSNGECTFCEACVRSCQTGALKLTDAPWRLRAVVSDRCLAVQGVVCMTCRDQCPELAIDMRPKVNQPAIPQIDLQRCTGCGACYSPCPTHAIQLLPTESP